MYEFIRIQYQSFHKLTADQVLAFAPRWITSEQAEKIING